MYWLLLEQECFTPVPANQACRLACILQQRTSTLRDTATDTKRDVAKVLSSIRGDSLGDGVPGVKFRTTLYLVEFLRQYRPSFQARR